VLLLYTPYTTARLVYILQFVESILHHPIVVTTHLNEFLSSTNPVKINYSNTELTNAIYQIKPHSLLSENNIHEVFIDIDTCRGKICFFRNEADHHGFDVFAACFYLISRYEEYLPHAKDEYGRFAYTNSIAYKYGFLEKPIVNFWLQDLQQQLHIFYPCYSIQQGNFQFIPTYDIDIAFANLYQPVYKKVYRYFKAFIKGNIDEVLALAKAFTNQISDVFDVYGWLQHLHNTLQLKPIFFYLLAEKNGQYDKNIPPSVKGFQQFLLHQATLQRIGIHPSWQSAYSLQTLQNEWKWFEKIIGKKPIYSRQHYIQMELPKTYETLMQQGIQFEFSMGYGSVNGFRASVASPFFWFHLEKNKATQMQVYPFCFMDANAYFEEGLTVEAAAKELQQYYDTVKAVNGTLVTIFHNHFLTEQPQWIDWRKMYEHFLLKNFDNNI